MNPLSSHWSLWPSQQEHHAPGGGRMSLSWRDWQPLPWNRRAVDADYEATLAKSGGKKEAQTAKVRV